MGSSQGGLLALGHAAIDPRIKACVSSLPALCDFMHTSAQEHSQEARDAGFLRVWQYFEPVNLARRIHAPTLLSSGGRDYTCPPPTIRAVYDRLPGVKALVHYPELGHGQSVAFNAMAWEWLRRYLA
jgi:cephalosporin-C deacetylase